jgi:hypothetical protein
MPNNAKNIFEAAWARGLYPLVTAYTSASTSLDCFIYYVTLLASVFSFYKVVMTD